MLILDEPTAGLDPEARAVVRARIAAERGAGTAVLLTSHELADVEPGSVGTSGRVFLVDAVRRWTDTGIDVRAGDVIRVQADGRISLSTNGADVAGPAGSATGRRAQDAPLREAAAGALIARVGNGSPMVVGQSESITVDRGGRLYLGVNDDYLLDNRGEFRVTIDVGR